MIFNKQPYSYRHASDVPNFPDSGPVCVMDARCALCARGARWIARNDRREEFRIVPLQSELGKGLLMHYGLDPEDPTSWLYLEDGFAHASLDALMRVGHRLGGIWKILFILRVIPAGLRDRLYQTVARNRYRWFGSADLCSLPDLEVQKRLQPRDDVPLYRQVLGDAFNRLPKQIQAIHDETQSRCWEGVARVRRGKGMISKVIGWVLGFPPESDQTQVTVQFDPHRGGEIWRRKFGSHSFSSVQSCGRGRNEHLLVERFGVIDVALALVAKDEKLFLIPRRWTLLGLPLPKWFMPAGNSFEAEVNGKFQFDVEISVPFVGLIAAYQGELEPSLTRTPVDA